MIVEARQRLKSLQQLAVARGTLWNGATTVSPVQKPEHIGGEWSITRRDDLDLLQVSPANSFDLAVWSLTNNLCVRQVHNESTLWHQERVWL